MAVTLPAGPQVKDTIERVKWAEGRGFADEIAILGTADECRARIREDMAGGIHTHVLAPLALDRAEAERTFEAFTPESFPLY